MARAWVKAGIAGLGLLLAGCFGAPSDGSGLNTPAASPPTATSAVVATPAPTDQAVETQPAGTGQVLLTVWMPDTLYASTDTPGRQAFVDQLAAFDEQHPEIRVQVYAKRLRGPGGTLSYLYTAPPVAPSILPDLALVDRDALAEAARGQLLIPMQSVAQPASVSDLYPAAFETGQIDGILVGLPYLLEVDQVVYRQTVVGHPPASFSDVLESGQLFAFAGGITSGVSPVILLQYLAEGGMLVDDKGSPALDPAALTKVLTFYSQARLRHNVTPELFQLTDSTAVWAMYRDRQANLAAVTSTQYLAGLSQVTSTRAGPIPTDDGKLHALTRGWSWALITKDPDRQAAALALLDFLMTPTNQGRYSQAAGWLPSQPAALTLWASQDTGYPAFAGQLLSSAHVMPDASARISVSAAMQDALEAVILNGATPAQAASRAADEVKTGRASQP